MRIGPLVRFPDVSLQILNEDQDHGEEEKAGHAAKLAEEKRSRPALASIMSNLLGKFPAIQQAAASKKDRQGKQHGKPAPPRCVFPPRTGTEQQEVKKQRRRQNPTAWLLLTLRVIGPGKIPVDFAEEPPNVAEPFRELIQKRIAASRGSAGVSREYSWPGALRKCVIVQAYPFLFDTKHPTPPIIVVEQVWRIRMQIAQLRMDKDCVMAQR